MHYNNDDCCWRKKKKASIYHLQSLFLQNSALKQTNNKTASEKKSLKFPVKFEDLFLEDTALSKEQTDR